MSWKKVKLGDILKQYRIEHRVDDKTIYKQVSILNDGSVVLRGEKIGKEIGRKRQFKIDTKKYPDTLIFTRQLLLQGSIGIASDNVHDCIVTENMPMFSIDTVKIDKEFLILFLKSEIFKSRIREIELSGSAQKSIHERTFLNLEFSIPPFELQKTKVVELLKLKSNSDNITIELTHQLSLVKKLRQQLLQDAVQGKLVKQNKKNEPASELLKKIKAEKEQLIKAGKLKKEKELPAIKEDDIPFEIPEGWEWCRLGEIAANIEYGTSQKAEMSSDHIPVLRMNNIQDGKIDYEKLKYVQSSIDDLPKLYLKEGDLLFNRTNSYELVGKSGVYHGAHDVMTFASYLIRVQFSKDISTDFVNHYINSSFCRKTQLEPEIIQQNGQANFNGTKLKNIICPLPPLAEQNRIVQKLDELMQHCNELEASIKESAAQNEKLLQQVLREALRKESVIKKMY